MIYNNYTYVIVYNKAIDFIFASNFSWRSSYIVGAPALDLVPGLSVVTLQCPDALAPLKRAQSIATAPGCELGPTRGMHNPLVMQWDSKCTHRLQDKIVIIIILLSRCCNFLAIERFRDGYIIFLLLLNISIVFMRICIPVYFLLMILQWSCSCQCLEIIICMRQYIIKAK